MVCLGTANQSAQLLTRVPRSLLSHTGATTRIHVGTRTLQPSPVTKLRASRAVSLQYRRWRHDDSYQSSTNAQNNSTGHASRQYLDQSSNTPHKEYFQSPGQSPKPDLSPYNRETPSQSSSFTPPPPAYLQHHPDALRQDGQPSQHKTYFQSGAASQSRAASFTRRFMRSTFYTFFFLSLGIATGTGLITWEYLSPMLEEGSEEEAEVLEEMLDIMEDSGLIVGLRAAGWREVDLSSPNMATLPNKVKNLAGSTPDTIPSTMGEDVTGKAEGVGMGRSMLYQMLTGSKGLIGLRMLHHPSQDCSIMVFCAGFGIEGWPDVVHGGMIATLLEEAVQRHIDWYHRGQIEKFIDVGVEFVFRQPVKPGELYAILIPPALMEPVNDPSNLGLTHGSVRSGVSKMQIASLFLSVDGSSKISVNISPRDESSGVESHDTASDVNSNEEQQEANIHALGRFSLKVVAGHHTGLQQQNLLDSVASLNASFSANHDKDADTSGD